jgi:hypothetical protein
MGRVKMLSTGPAKTVSGSRSIWLASISTSPASPGRSASRRIIWSASAGHGSGTGEPSGRTRTVAPSSRIGRVPGPGHARIRTTLQSAAARSALTWTTTARARSVSPARRLGKARTGGPVAHERTQACNG